MDDRERASAAGRDLVAHRRIVQGVCIRCGKPIEGTTKRRYCGDVCRVLTYRARKREREKEAGKAETAA